MDVPEDGVRLNGTIFAAGGERTEKASPDAGTGDEARSASGHEN
jgi:hypothetical protein